MKLQLTKAEGAAFESMRRYSARCGADAAQLDREIDSLSERRAAILADAHACVTATLDAIDEGHGVRVPRVGNAIRLTKRDGGRALEIEFDDPTPAAPPAREPDAALGCPACQGTGSTHDHAGPAFVPAPAAVPV